VIERAQDMARDAVSTAQQAAGDMVGKSQAGWQRAQTVTGAAPSHGPAASHP
jgi:hypothetical protein